MPYFKRHSCTHACKKFTVKTPPCSIFSGFYSETWLQKQIRTKQTLKVKHVSRLFKQVKCYPKNLLRLSSGSIRATLSIFWIQPVKPRMWSFKQTFTSGYKLWASLVLEYKPSMYEVLHSLSIFLRECLIRLRW